MNNTKNRIALVLCPVIRLALVAIAFMMFLPLSKGHGQNGLPYWRVEFPKTNFIKREIDLSEVKDTEARRDSIPPIWNPTFIPAFRLKSLGRLEPVISLRIAGHARAYPLRILLWHEILNDHVGDTPLLVTYCPLNNSGIVFNRDFHHSRQKIKTLFGNTGRLRNFDTVMYDRKTESWWQRYTGKAIIGELAGTRLNSIPSRLESFKQFLERNPNGKVLIPNTPNARNYGATPYIRMDTSPGIGLESFELPVSVQPYDRVVAVGRNAWTMKMLETRRVISTEGLVIRWHPGQNSIHDTKRISFGRDVGSVTVQRFNPVLETWDDAAYQIPFAFAFKAFNPDGTLYYDIPSKSR